MPTESRNSSSLIILQEGHDGDVLCETKNEDKFVLTAQDALNACRAWDKSVKFTAQFRDLLERLSDWTQEHASQLSVAKLSVRSNGVLFVVVQKNVQRDPELASQLTDLDLEIAQSDDFDLIEFDVLALPKTPSDEASSAFLASGQVYTHAQ